MVTGGRIPPVSADEGQELGKAYLELKRQYDDLVSRNLAGVFRTTVDGRILEVNDSMARILGYQDRDELLRLDALDLYPSAAARDVFLQTLFREKRLINFEITLKHRSGGTVDVLENVFLDEQEGRPATIQGTLIDITSFKQAELEQRSLMASYRGLVEQIRDGLLVVKDGQITYANPAAEKLVGRPIVGDVVLDLFHTDDRTKVQHFLSTGAADGMNGPFPIRLADSDHHGFVILMAPAPHHGPAAMQLTLQDQRAQQQLFKEQLRLQMAEEVNQVLRQEINDHRRTQEALRRSKRFARSLVDSSLDMIMAADPEGNLTEYNPAASLRFGYEPEEILGLNSRVLYADRTDYERVQYELNNHGAFSGEVRNISSTGEVFTSFLAASRLYDEDGQLLGGMGVSRDITRMKRDQESLKASEERYRDLFENATDMIQSVAIDGRFEYVNAAWLSTLGYSREQLGELTLHKVIAPDHWAPLQRLFERALKGEDIGRVATVFLARDGRSVHVEGTTSVRMVDGRSVATRSIFHDVTAERTARLQVQEHEAKLRALFESSDHLFWTAGSDLKLTSFNSGYSQMIERIYGARPEINKDPDRPRKLFADQGYHDFWATKYAEAFAGSPVRFETDLRDTKGQRVCNEIFLSPVFAADGQVIEVFGVGHEITDKVMAEDLVREQAARLQAIFDSSANMMVWTMDTDFRITSCNAHFQRSAEEDFGITLGVGDKFTPEPAERTSGKSITRTFDHYKAALKGKPQQFEAELVDRHGRTIWVENFINPILVDGKVMELSGLAYHITERKEAQRELLRSLHEKEVLLKEVHHRVKNNLQIVSSIFNLQSAHVGEDQRMIGLLRDSRDRIRSMSFIHESLYQTKDFSSIDLAEYIAGLSRNLVMSYSLNGKVELKTQLERVLLVLDQAIPCGLILNELISNALKHAFPQDRSGSITLQLQLVDEKVHISVGDDGVGLSPGFDPWTQGNLGLELVHTLVEQLDGHITHRPDPGVTYLLTFERIKNSGNGADERPRSGG